MINTPYTYKGFTLNDSPRIYHLTAVDGFDSPALREARENRPAMDGQIDYASLLGERLMALKGKILASSISERDSRRQPLLNAFKEDGIYDWLKWQVPGQVAKQIYCKVFDLKIDDRYDEDPFIRNFIINLIAIDPRIYSQEELTKTVYIPSTEGGRVYAKTYPKTYGTVQTGGKIVCTNNGNYSVWPIVKMYGPLSSPKIRNNDDGQKEIQINMVISDGDYLEVDFLEKTVMLNGTASRYNYLASSPDQWWKINPYNNEIEFRDGGGDITAYAQIIYRYGWI